jgi:hypothetical protein
LRVFLYKLRAKQLEKRHFLVFFNLRIGQLLLRVGSSITIYQFIHWLDGNFHELVLDGLGQEGFFDVRFERVEQIVASKKF